MTFQHPDQYLLTGATGWLGKRLLRMLARRAIDLGPLAELPPSLIRCLVLPGQNNAELRAFGELVEVVEGDLRNPRDCARFCEGARGAVLLHVAGVIHPARVAEFYDVNARGTDNLLGAAVAAGVKRLVVASSNSPTGCNPHPDHVFDEEAPYDPYMNLGRSQVRMEMAVKQVSSQGKVETVIIRAPWFYGPDQPARQTLFFSMIRQGKIPIVGSGNNRRSMGYIDNVCQGFILAAIHPRSAGQIYWIADRQPYTMNEIIDTVESLLENEFHMAVAHKRVRLPDVASAIAQVCDTAIQATGLYNQKIHVLSEMNKNIACSIAKAEAELGYVPQISLEEGMRRSIAWCLEQGISI